MPYPGPDSPACASCGLWRQASPERSFLSPEVSPGWSDHPEKPVVLVVVPWSREASSSDTEGGDLLRIVMSGMQECRWIITGTLRCPAPGKRGDVPSTFHRLCMEAHLPDDVNEFEPKVVVLLGQESCNAFLGSQAPKRFTSALRRTIKGVDGWPPIVIGRSPFYHDPSDDRDAFDEWVELFTRAEKIATGKDLGAALDYEEVSDPGRAVAICEALPLDFTWDTEYDGHEDDPARRTYWFEGAENLCWSVDWDARDGGRKTVTFVPPAANDSRVWAAAFRGRRPCAHFAKVDFQEPFATLGVDLFPLVRRLDTGEIDYRDPGQEIHLCDQGTAGLGILTIAMDHCGAENWKQKKDEMIASGNRELARAWARYSEWSARNGEAWKAVREWERYEEKRQDKMVVAQHGPTEKKRSNAAAWLAKNPLVPRPDDPGEPEKPDRPPGTCGFAAAIPYLYHYCGEDSYWTSVALHTRVPAVKESLGGCGPVVTRLLSRAVELTCEVERVGLPVDMSRVRALQEHLLDVQREVREQMLHHEPVRLALARHHEVRFKLERGADPLEVALEHLNPGSPIFRLAFARELGLDLEAHRKEFFTKSGKPSFNKKALAVLTQPAIPWDEATEDVRLWRAFAKLKNARDLYAKTGMFRFVERGYVRTDYRVVKVTKADHDGGSEGDAQGTNTGRLSAGFLQGLKKDPAFRSAFVTPPGWVFVEVDYSTLEPRILAHLIGIREWQVWFERGYDLYCGMANQMFNLGVDVDHPDHEGVARDLKACIEPAFRNKIMKPCFLAQMYMQGYESLAKATGMPVEKTQEFQVEFHRAFPQLKEFQAKLWENMLAGRPVVTPFGRQSYPHLPDPKDSRYKEKLASEHRHNWNLPVQGTGSDCLIWLVWGFMREMKLASRWGGPHARLGRDLVPVEYLEKRDGVRRWGALCNLIHDAVWGMVRVEHFKDFVRPLVTRMERREDLPFMMTSPLCGEVKAGRELSHLHKVDSRTLELPEAALEA